MKVIIAVFFATMIPSMMACLTQNGYVGINTTITDGPGEYGNDEDCIWGWNTTEPGHLVITEMALEAGYDYLYLVNVTSYDGQSLGQFEPPYTLCFGAGDWELQFTSDGTITRAGFTLELRGPPGNVSAVCDSSFEGEYFNNDFDDYYDDYDFYDGYNGPYLDFEIVAFLLLCCALAVGVVACIVHLSKPKTQVVYGVNAVHGPPQYAATANYASYGSVSPPAYGAAPAYNVAAPGLYGSTPSPPPAPMNASASSPPGSYVGVYPSENPYGASGNVKRL